MDYLWYCLGIGVILMTVAAFLCGIYSIWYRASGRAAIIRRSSRGGGTSLS
jgi:hypothetical protein